MSVTAGHHRAAVSEAGTRADARAYLLGIDAAELEALYTDTGRHIAHPALPDNSRRTITMANRIIGRVRG